MHREDLSTYGMQKVIGNSIDHGEDDVGAALLGGSVEKKVHSSIGISDFWDFFLDSSRCVRFLKSVWSTWE